MLTNCYLLQKRKEPIGFDRWALSISRTSMDFNDGLTGLENLIGHYLPLAYEETEPVRQKVRLTGLLFSFTYLGPNTLYRIPTYSLLTPPAEVCELLLKEAKALSLSK